MHGSPRMTLTDVSSKETHFVGVDGASPTVVSASLVR
ncbi:hypothetical protein CSUI_009025 [Cystoisospora suis]|uniref:Uncharacterized protein n=1 Tax=Cystoisospora suis TaxID=483139 RepID=A0A2C6KL99_9APIC|nr:hypothetical protein CSUI_009025 [Cystoisospora suis]